MERKREGRIARLAYNPFRCLRRCPCTFRFWALLILLIFCVWAVATRASRSYAEAIDAALGEAKRDLANKIDSLKDHIDSLEDDLRDLHSEVDQLRSDTEVADDNLRTDVDSHDKETGSLRSDLDCIRDETESE